MASLKNQLIISFSIIVVSVVAATVALYLISGDIAAQVKTIQADRASISQDTGALTLVSDLKKQESQVDGYQAAIDQLLPTQDGLIGFSSWIGTIANANQVTATVSFSGNPLPPVTGLQGSSGFSLEVDGSLANIVAFLKDVETSPGFLLQISSYDLVASGSGDRLTAQGVVFFRAQ